MIARISRCDEGLAMLDRKEPEEIARYRDRAAS
jgi:hypothetical protein